MKVLPQSIKAVTTLDYLTPTQRPANSQLSGLSKSSVSNFHTSKLVINIFFSIFANQHDYPQRHHPRRWRWHPAPSSHSLNPKAAVAGL